MARALLRAASALVPTQYASLERSSELAVETSTIEKISRIEHTLDVFHNRKVSAWFRPQVQVRPRGLG